MALPSTNGEVSMPGVTKYPEELKRKILEEYATIPVGTPLNALVKKYGVPRNTIWAWAAAQAVYRKHTNPSVSADRSPDAPAAVAPIARKPRLMFVDIETVPNLGCFFQTLSERSIPKKFIIKHKAICVIGYKFDDDESVTVLTHSEPYEDRTMLEKLLEDVKKADYIVWHYGEGFDRKFIEGRLMANGLPAMPPTQSIDTCKLARAKWGDTLNGNSLAHLALFLGLTEQKREIDSSVFVKCAQGDKDAIIEMAEYNAQDVLTLEALYHRIKHNIKDKVNHNLFYDDPINRCKSCGSENLRLDGLELLNNTYKHRYQCGDCSVWSSFPRKKK